MKVNTLTFFTLAMAIFFAYQFFVCIRKYLKYETIDNKKVVQQDVAAFPYVTITPVPGYRNPKAGSFFDIDSSVDDFCVVPEGNATQEEPVGYKACIDAGVFEVTDLVDLVLQNKDVIPVANLTQPSSPLLVALGRTFTFHLDKEIEGAGKRLMFKIKGNSNDGGLGVYPTLVFTFHAKDTYFPYVYLDAKNFDGRAETSFTASTHTHAVTSVLLRKRIRIDTPENPCIDEEGYSNMKCTEEHIARSVGCKSPWTNIKSDLPDCQTKDEFNKLIQLQTKLFQMAASDFLIATGCYQPCTKDEVEVIKFTTISYPYFPDGANSLSVVVVSTSYIEIKETLIYDINSLVGEVGGSLGLFLGLSLINLYSELCRVAGKYFPKVSGRVWGPKKHGSGDDLK